MTLPWAGRLTANRCSSVPHETASPISTGFLPLRSKADFLQNCRFPWHNKVRFRQMVRGLPTSRLRSGNRRGRGIAAGRRLQKIPRDNSNDFNPMWVGDKIYFLSDRDGPVSLFSYDMHAKEVKKELENRGLDLKSASAGPDAIVYEQFGSLHLYDLKS